MSLFVKTKPNSQRAEHFPQETAIFERTVEYTSASYGGIAISKQGTLFALCCCWRRWRWFSSCHLLLPDTKKSNELLANLTCHDDICNSDTSFTKASIGIAFLRICYLLTIFVNLDFYFVFAGGGVGGVLQWSIPVAQLRCLSQTL